MHRYMYTYVFMYLPCAHTQTLISYAIFYEPISSTKLLKLRLNLQLFAEKYTKLTNASTNLDYVITNIYVCLSPITQFILQSQERQDVRLPKKVCNDFL